MWNKNDKKNSKQDGLFCMRIPWAEPPIFCFCWNSWEDISNHNEECNIQSVANIFFWTEYEYEYIRNALLYTNTNTNIFGIKFWTEYEYEYIRDQILDRIRIRIYLKYQIGPNTNIRIFIIQSLWNNSRYLTSCDSIYWLKTYTIKILRNKK